MKSEIAFIILLTVTLIVSVLMKDPKLDLGLLSVSGGTLKKKITNCWKKLHGPKGGNDLSSKIAEKKSTIAKVAVIYNDEPVIYRPKAQEKIVSMKDVNKNKESLAFRRRNHRGKHRHHQGPGVCRWRQISKMKPISLEEMKRLLSAINQSLQKRQEEARLHENYNYSKHSDSKAYMVAADREALKCSLDRYLHKINDLLIDILLSQGKYQIQFGKAAWMDIQKQIRRLIHMVRAITAKLSMIYRSCFPEYHQITKQDALAHYLQYEQTRAFKLISNV